VSEAQFSSAYRDRGRRKIHRSSNTGNIANEKAEDVTHSLHQDPCGVGPAGPMLRWSDHHQSKGRIATLKPAGCEFRWMDHHSTRFSAHPSTRALRLCLTAPTNMDVIGWLHDRRARCGACSYGCVWLAGFVLAPGLADVKRPPSQARWKRSK
jgi:hypothetical protein